MFRALKNRCPAGAAWVAALFLAATPPAIWPPVAFAQVADVRVVSETAPAGGLAVVQIELTEPEPILSGRFSFSFPAGPLRTIRGVGLFSDQFDVVGSARVLGNRLSVRFASFFARMGLSERLPIFVVAIDVDPNAAPGQRSQLILDPNQLRLIDPGGRAYPQEIKPGDFTVGGLSLTSVTPSRGTVQTGTPIVFRGVGFDSDADVSIDGVELTSVQVVSAGEIRAVAAQAFRMEGRRVRIRNKQRDEEDFFFVFTPAIKVETTRHPLLVDLVPIFDDRALTTGLLRSVRSGGDAATGMAFENRGTLTADLTIEVSEPSRGFVGQASLTVLPGQRTLHEVSELVPGAGELTAGAVAVRSSQPIAMLALIGDSSDETLTPVIFSDEALPDPRPAITEGGIVLATLAPAGPTVSPRALGSIFGQNLATAGPGRQVGVSDLVAGRLPTELAGVCVEMGGIRAPMLFVRSDQLNVQIPSLAARGPVAVEVISRCGTPEELRSPAATMQVGAVSPGFFVLRFDGPGNTNPVAALHGGGPELIGDPSEVPGARAAQPGEFVSLFGTGFGGTDPVVVAGAIPLREPSLSRGQASLTGEISVSIGGITAGDILYAGVAPCCAGLDQIVVRVPSSAPDGKLPLAATIDGVATPAGPYLTVRRP